MDGVPDPLQQLLSIELALRFRPRWRAALQEEDAVQWVPLMLEEHGGKRQLRPRPHVTGDLSFH